MEKESKQNRNWRERERETGEQFPIGGGGGGGGSVGKQQNSELRCQDCDDRMDSAPM